MCFTPRASCLARWENVDDNVSASANDTANDQGLTLLHLKKALKYDGPNLLCMPEKCREHTHTHKNTHTRTHTHKNTHTRDGCCFGVLQRLLSYRQLEVYGTCSSIKSVLLQLSALSPRKMFLLNTVSVSRENLSVCSSKHSVCLQENLSVCTSKHRVCLQGKPVCLWLSLVAALHSAQHTPLPPPLLPYHPCHHRQHHGQVQRHQTSGESSGQGLYLDCDVVQWRCCVFWGESESDTAWA